jgi:hypothetical protein
MSPALISVFGIVLGTPILAALALVAIGSVEPEILTASLMFGVPIMFAVGFIFEVRRRSGKDNLPSEQSLAYRETHAPDLGKPKVYEKVEDPATGQTGTVQVVEEPEMGPVPPPGYSLDETTERPVDESITRPAPEPQERVAEEPAPEPKPVAAPAPKKGKSG